LRIIINGDETAPARDDPMIELQAGITETYAALAEIGG
jgi:hypothetical protein